MPNLPVLADASIWIKYFRNPSGQTTAHLQKLLRAGFVRTCGIILAEVLQGTKTEEELHLIHDLFQAIPYLDDLQEDWKNAALIVFRLRKKGVSLTLSDALIAAIAQRYNCVLFTLDKDFSRVPNLKLLNL